MTFSQDRYVAALEFAAARHRTQLVPGTDLPYVVHVVSVAAEVIAALDETSIDQPDLAVQCALLHDTIEDTGTRYDEVAAAFGAPVADGVAALSKDEALPKAERMADSLRRIRLQPREIWLVKLADRITNLREPPAHWSAEKRGLSRRGDRDRRRARLGEPFARRPAPHANRRVRAAPHVGDGVWIGWTR